MANELTATNAEKTLLTLSLKPHELDKHRAAIGVEVEASLNNGGYWREPSSALVRMKMLMKWMDALQNYSLDEIEAAFCKHVLSNPSRKPNEGHIRSEIISARQRSVASQPMERETYIPCPNPMTPERHAEILAEHGRGDGEINVRSFMDKPTEVE